MKCLICMTPDTDRPGRGESDFAALFGPLVRGLSGYSWLIDGGLYSPWSWPPDWYGDDARLEAIDDRVERMHRVEDKVLVTSEFFQEHMRYLSDDWVDVYAFPHRPTRLDRTRQAVSAPLPQAVEIPVEAAYTFINVDGAFWALLTEDEAAIKAVVDRWRHCELHPVSLRGYDSMP